MKKLTDTHFKILLAALFGGAALFTGVAFFVWTVIPYAQMGRFYKEFRRAVNGTPSALMDSQFAFSPYTSVQPALRYTLIAYLFDEYKAGRLDNTAPLIPFAIEKMKETANRDTAGHPYYFSSIAKAYDELAEVHPDAAGAYYKQAEVYYKESLARSPNNYNQDARYAYAINLTNQGRTDEAVTLLRATLAADTRVPLSHYFLGVILFKQGFQNSTEALHELEYALDHDADPSPTLSKKIYQKLLYHFYNTKEVDQFLIVIRRLPQYDPAQASIYATIIEYVTKHHSVPLLDLQQ